MTMDDKKPLVAISACLAGEAVRYDGQHKQMPELLNSLKQHVELRTLCPEVGAGLGVPRAPVQLVGSIGRSIRAQGVDNPDLDVTDALYGFSRNWLQNNRDVCGAVIKARSPSCGYQTTPLFTDGRLVGYADGLFAHSVQQADFPFPLIDEEKWVDQHLRAGFIKQLMFVWRWRQLADTSATSLQVLHARYKYLLMMHSSSACTELGRVIANTSEKNAGLRAQLYYNGVLTLLSQEVIHGRVVNVLQHMAGYLKQQKKLHLSVEAYAAQEKTLHDLIASFQEILAVKANKYLQQQVLLFPDLIEREWAYVE